MITTTKISSFHKKDLKKDYQVQLLEIKNIAGQWTTIFHSLKLDFEAVSGWMPGLFLTVN